jgi:glycosyltransferase involved in cell wall biosynthesis
VAAGEGAGAPNMKVLHVTFTYPPDPAAGTEVYVAQLCRNLGHMGITSVVAAPAAEDQIYCVDDVRVRRFACNTERQTLEMLYGGGDPTATHAFERVLIDERPDVVHQHALSPACSIELVRCARRHHVPVVFTVHTPAAFCQRGTLLRWGRQMCDVVWSAETCTPCVLDGLGAGPAVGQLVSSLPTGVGRAMGRFGLSGGPWTGMRMSALMEQRLAAVRELFATASRVVSLSPWTTRLLEHNGVPAERIVCSPHGIDLPSVDSLEERPIALPVRLVHLGRLDASKGTVLVSRAIVADPSMAVTLDIYGLEQGESAGSVATAVRRLAARDSRIRLHAAVPQSGVVSMLRSYDALLVPSQFAETGPLVALEAFAARVPVIGSDLAGIAEKIRHGVNGLLVTPFDDERAWTRTIRECVDDPDLIGRLRNGIEPPRGALEVARDMSALYREVAAAAPR